MSYNEVVKVIFIFAAGITAGLLVAVHHDELSKAILIFVAGIISGVAPRLIYDWWKRPQISINGIDVTGQCHSIFVKNKGKSAAIKCEAMLTLPNIDSKEDIIDSKEIGIKKATMTAKSFREIKDMNLSWARRANGTSCSIAVTIYSGARQLLNFYNSEKPDLAIIIASENGFDLPRVALKSNREYKGEIKIFAENVEYDSKKHKKKFIISKANDGDVKFEFI